MRTLPMNRFALALLVTAAASARADAPHVAFTDLVDKLTSGDALIEGLQTVVAAAGQPNAYEDNQVRWYAMTSKTECSYLSVEDDGGYVGDVSAGNVAGPGASNYVESERAQFDACKKGST